MSSIKYDADLVLTKTATDVIVVGHAYAPAERPVASLEVGFRVGSLQKVLRVTGDRTWGPVSVSEAAPFVKMPIVYERAFGGVDTRSDHPERDWDWRNPVGTGFAVSRENITGLSLPNIEYADEAMAAWNDRPHPAGFGPIGLHWQPRAGFAGTYDDTWKQNRDPLLPDDFDDRYYQCAPEDQQVPGFLHGGEPVALYHLTPDGDLRFLLPKVFLAFETFFVDGERRNHEKAALHAVVIEPDYPRVSLVWQTALPCHPKVYKLDKTRIFEKEIVRPGAAPEEMAEEETP